LEEDSGRKRKVDRRAATFIVVLAALAAIVPGASYSLTYLQVCLGTAVPVSFTIVMTNEGFNGSKSHTDAWPVLNVQRCDRVTVHLVNQDMSESHGFAVTHYLDSGVKVLPGDAVDVSFNANRAGSFVVYCNILCFIHLYMQNGKLNVR
jgi:heme/copper-type cytochrome/quinol oxidase subunit 2